MTPLFPAALVLGWTLVAVLPADAPLFATALAIIETAVGAGGEYLVAQTSPKLIAVRAAKARPPTAPTAVPVFVANANSMEKLTISAVAHVRTETPAFAAPHQPRSEKK